jgi:flagellar protein FlgJ
VKAVAQQVEALFLQMMLKSMRDAAADVGVDQGNEMGMYQDMFDKQISLNISQHQDLGLSALLSRQTGGAAAPKADAGTAAAAVHSAVAAALASMAGAPGSGAAAGDGDEPPLGYGAAGAGSAAEAQAMAQSPADFVKMVLPAVNEAAQALGLSPLGVLAQAVLETGWGKRMVRNADGSPSLNLFGIKADESWEGARAAADSLEYSGGAAALKRSTFRAYGTIADSVSDFASLLQHSPRYRDVVAAGGNAQAYVDRIGKSGYATDPQYTNKLNEILHSSTFKAAVILGSAAL